MLGGAGQDQQELLTQMGIALVMGSGLTHLIMVMQFGSFTAPLAVMLSLIGVVKALPILPMLRLIYRTLARMRTRRVDQASALGKAAGS